MVGLVVGLGVWYAFLGFACFPFASVGLVGPVGPVCFLSVSVALSPRDVHVAGSTMESGRVYDV